jgi:hypothetical protein
MINIGMDMKNIKLPQYEIVGYYDPATFEEDGMDSDNMYVNPSALYSYLNVRGLGRTTDGEQGPVRRQFNAVPLLGYWEIYANYYANKQEGDKFGKAEGVVVHSSDPSNEWGFGIMTLETTQGSGTPLGPISVVPGGNPTNLYMNGFTEGQITCVWDNGTEPYGDINLDLVYIVINSQTYSINQLFNVVNTTIYPQTYSQQQIGGVITFSGYNGTAGYGSKQILVPNQLNYTLLPNTLGYGTQRPELTRFPLENINEMREKILQAVASTNAVNPIDMF